MREKKLVAKKSLGVASASFWGFHYAEQFEFKVLVVFFLCWQTNPFMGFEGLSCHFHEGTVRSKTRHDCGSKHKPDLRGIKLTETSVAQTFTNLQSLTFLASGDSPFFVWNFISLISSARSVTLFSSSISFGKKDSVDGVSLPDCYMSWNYL